jgi:hypothetical protein
MIRGGFFGPRIDQGVEKGGQEKAAEYLYFPAA